MDDLGTALVVRYVFLVVELPEIRLTDLLRSLSYISLLLPSGNLRRQHPLSSRKPLSHHYEQLTTQKQSRARG